MDPVDRLVAIEEIQQLKARYFRALDTNDWDLMRETLTEDAESWYSSGKYTFRGRDEILKFLSDSMSGEHFLSMHHGHHPEIEITSETTATGIWYLTDIVIQTEQNWQLFGAGIYQDEYVKIDGAWKIRRTGYDRTFEQAGPRDETQKIVQNMFAK